MDICVVLITIAVVFHGGVWAKRKLDWLLWWDHIQTAAASPSQGIETLSRETKRW